MAVYKDKKTNNWRAVIRYTNYKGERKQTQKRGFKTKKEAQEWERAAMLKQTSSLDMTFQDFFALYAEYARARVKEGTWETKEYIVRTKILPYFGKRKIGEISATDVHAWQNDLLELRKENGEKYSPDYLRSIHAQLSAIFNHAVNYYSLPHNPAQQAGTIGKEAVKEMLFWTKSEYLNFAEAIMDKPRAYYAFELLYWTGIREGELLALTPADFDLENRTLSITKTYHRSHGRDIITDPKTPKSRRVIRMPGFLCEEIQDYLGMLYEVKASDRIFSFSKQFLRHEMKRGCQASGVKVIRIHDLRHSHISLLINMGFSALAIGERVGHEAEKITYRYAHLFPTVQTEMVRKLEDEWQRKDEEAKE